MKAPDLADVEEAGVRAWTGPAEPLKSAAAHAHLAFASADLAHAKDRAALFAELDRALKLPDHFGHNWDALDECLRELVCAGPLEHIASLVAGLVSRRNR